MRILLVGGAVRNLLLGRPLADKDFVVTDEDETGFLRRYPQARKVGGHFPVFLLDGREFALLRAPDLDGDLHARDLTVNAMALDEDGFLYCHPLALQDLQDRVLRPCGPECMAQDPLRVFRSARFAAQLPDFTPHSTLLEAMTAAARSGMLENITPERVGHELLLALAGPAPSHFLRLLHMTGCLPPWFKELAESDDIPAGPTPHHHESVFKHTCRVMDKLTGDPLAVWMGMTHDLGKTGTPPDLWPSHPGHEAAGASLAQRMGQRLRLPNRFLKAGEAAAKLHMKAARYPDLRPGSLVDLLMGLHAKGLVRQMFALVKADHGRDYLGPALADLKLLLGIRLPEGERDQGPDSGARLRELRAQILAEEKLTGKSIDL